ncbi:acetate--CoA ligase family protein [Neobacillus sp. 114]|uniref:acetate--CoA ligase family protein n=1 Tax=Neobacillus sp. 114 TaxID=3048535 RepID=UPI0024C2CA74|nr:acetate--CoA ligase family protein [Neobacillus sp. 114]
MKTDFEKFFKPKSIAIVGASPNEKSIGGRTISHLLKYKYSGDIYPVNPKYDQIKGIQAYPDIKSIPNTVDLAIIIVAAKGIPRVIDQCLEKKVPFAIIFSSGFAEAGTEGEYLQSYLKNITKNGDIRILGPNCQGMFNIVDEVAATFSGALELPSIIPGPVGFVSQSGALGFSTFNQLEEEGIGFNYVVSTGNEADLEVTDFLIEFATHDQTEVLVSYVEGFKKPERLFDLAEICLREEKPLLIFKVGNSELGAKAASSHTAALAGSSDLYDSLFKQIGITKVSDIEEVADLCKILTKTKRPPGNRVGIITTSGGAGVILADHCAINSIDVPPLAEPTKQILQQYLPDFGSDLNPVDLTAQVAGSEELFNESVNAVANDPNIDILIVALTMVTGPRAGDMAKFLIKKSKEMDKPLVVVWMAGDQLAKPGFEVLKSEKLTFFKSPKRCIETLRKFIDIHSNFKRRKEIYQFISERRECLITTKSIENNLNEYEAKRWLNQQGLPVTKEKIARFPEEAVKYATEIGFPVALKVVSNKIPHKTDVGGVALNLCSPEEVENAYLSIKNNIKQNTGLEIDNIIVQEMVLDGIEVFVGCHVDPQLGPSLTFGLGGIFVEVLKDTKTVLPPISQNTAKTLIQELNGSKVLTGVRGQQSIDLDLLAEFISRFSRICASLKQEIQIDLNPVVITKSGIKIVDALVIVEEEEKNFIRSV